MNRFGLVIVSALLASTFLVDVQAKQAFFEFENDPHYPQLVHVSNVQYQLVNDNSIEFSAAVTIYEELNDGTNIKINVSPDFPYARMINNMDVNMCNFCRREMPIYGRLVESSNGQFPDRCPIRPGVYTINGMRLDLDKWPLLWRGFSTAATITLHKNGRILSKWNVKCSVTP